MIDSVYGLLKQARKIPGRYGEGMLRVLEDWEAQFQIWLKDPSKLSEDESCHEGVRLVLERLLEK